MHFDVAFPRLGMGVTQIRVGDGGEREGPAVQGPNSIFPRCRSSVLTASDFI